MHILICLLRYQLKSNMYIRTYILAYAFKSKVFTIK